MSAPAASGVEDLPARRGRRGRPGGRAFWRAAEWPLVGALIVVAVVLGYVGFKQYYDALGQHASPLDCLYFSLQLFTMNSSFAVAPIPWALQVARFLAPALAVYVAIKALLAVFRDQVWRLRARLFLKDHVVVCGLGARGVELTDQFLAQGCRVVAIESDVDNPLVESCRDRGAHVIVGDATDETVLRSAAVQTAGHLVAVLPEDGDNAEVAVRARRLKGDDDGRTLTAHVHMADLELCDLLRERDAENRPGSPFRLRFFNVMESGARMMLDEVSPNAPGRRRGRRYVVVGLGKMGRSLVQQAAREWPLVRRDAGDRLRLTLIDTAAGDKLELLRLRHPFLDDTCEIESLSLAKNAAEFERAAFLRGSDGEPADAVFLCFDDDVHVLASALTLDRRAGAAIPIVMRLSEKSGLAALFDDDSAGVIGGDLRPVPLLEWSCDPDLLLRGEGETLARALFAGAMSRGREAHEDGSGSRGATAAWNALGASQQDAWRGFAERLDDWLAAAGCRAWHSSGLMPEFAFTAEEAEALERQGWPPSPSPSRGPATRSRAARLTKGRPASRRQRPGRGLTMKAETTDEALAWAEAQVATLARRRADYVTFADTLQQVLNGVAKRYCPLAIVQARAKGVASFADKALRKRAAHPDPVNQFTDLCGARLIAQTVDQVETVCDFLKTHFVIDWENSADVSERLRATEFGYRSVHYIVSFKPGVFPTKDVPVEVPPRLLEMPNPRAEVQVRTVLEHAWADISHELLYKGGFQVPRVWEREFARLAALLEDGDATVTRLHGALQAYVSSYAYMSPEQMRNRVTQCLFVLSKDPSDLTVVREIAALSLLLAEWDTVIEALLPYIEDGDAAVMRDYGLALCGKYADDRSAPEFARGREMIERACTVGAADAKSWLALAESWVGDDLDLARKNYRRAFETDPTDESVLEKYLDMEIKLERSLEIVDIVRPLIEAGLSRCRRRAEIGVDLAAAHLTMGKFLLLLGDPYRSLAAYAKGAQAAAAPQPLDEALRSLAMLRDVADRLEGYEWARRVLLLRLATWRETSADGAETGSPARGAASAEQAAAARRARRALAARHLKTLADLATPSAEPLPRPVVMVAGGCDPALDKQMKAYRMLIVEGFRGFCGTVISGGTKEGISGLVGEMARKYAGSVTAVTYLPESLPLDATVDPRYGVRHTTKGATFSPLQPLQAWTDLVVAGVDPADVHLLGINGGPIAAAEYRIALSLGAAVALVEESGREAARVIPDEDWGGSARLLRIPADAATVREFVALRSECEKLDEGLRETLGREIHEEYRSNRQKSLRSDEPTMKPWSRLRRGFQESNRDQADSIPRKLEEIGCFAVEPKGRPVRLLKFTHDEVEHLSEIEHARWVIEKLQNGWTLGPKRDPDRKTSPYLVPWADLSDDVRELDRQTVRKIPEFLATVGLEVRRRRGARAAPVASGGRDRRPRT